MFVCSLAPDAVCPEGDWVKYENHCYSFHKVIWEKVQLCCC